jgi:predicted DNA-binding transcriptional regulator YafY
VLRGVVTYLVAVNDPFDDRCSFAPHQIVSAEVLDLPRGKPEGFNLACFIAAGAFGFEESGPIRFALRFYAAAAEHLRETPLSKDQASSNPEDGKVTFTATVLDTQQLRWWLLGFDDEVEVLKPATLRKAVAAHIRNAADAYEEKRDGR